ncbi:hypothetical protein FRC17_001253 [Serendipita sp. 399]|nr:hypothetical protein FRC17_001253 [Serendipita sp. 399]
MANTSLAAEFWIQFRLECQDRITSHSTSPTLNQKEDLLSSISKLRKDLNDATPFLPTYDQRQSELQLKELEKKLDNLLQDGPSGLGGKGKGSSKFSFKRTPKAATTTSSPLSSVNSTPSTETVGGTSTSAPLNSTLENTIPPAGPQIGDGGTNIDDSNRTISIHDRNGEHITLSSIFGINASTHVTKSEERRTKVDVLVFSLSNCIVDLTSQSHVLNGSIGAFHARELKRCILVLPQVEGSALIHDCVDCIIAVACHQFRIHTSARTDVYLHVTSLPVLEKCTAMRFAPYPSLSTSPSTNGLEENANRFSEVQDFLWIRSTPSPNWSILPASQRLSGGEWLGLEKSEESVEVILDRLITGRGQQSPSGT